MGVSLQDSPGRSHQFVRERDDDHVRMGPGLEAREPPSQAVRLLAMMTADGSCAMNEQATEIGIATFTNAPKHGLAARGMLPRHQPEPRGEIAPLRKRRAVADGGDEAVAVSGPMPGTCMSRSQATSLRARLRSS